MAKELKTSRLLADATFYALLYNDDTGQVYKPATTTFETWVDANFASYPLTLTEEGTSSGRYSADLPVTQMDKRISYEVRHQAGASPALTDEAWAVGEVQPLLYHADIHFTQDKANERDEWTVSWFRDGVRDLTVSNTIIQATKRDGTFLFVTAMTPIGATGTFKLDESVNRLANGEAVVVTVFATAGGEVRTFLKNISRDST